MKVQVMTERGDLYKAESAKEMVTQLKLEMYTPPKSRATYMRGVGTRCIQWDDEHLTYTNEMEFLKELNRVGVILMVLG